MRISDFIARTITQRRALVWCGVAVLTIVCIAILLTSLRLDSEIFNVLPGRFPSVQGLKIYDHDFEQTRELTFALVCDPQDVDKLEEFALVFAERLRGQPWCARVLGFAHDHCGWHSRCAIDRGPVAAEPGTKRFRRGNVDPATRQNSRSPSSFTPADRGGLAAAAIRAFVRSARIDCARAQTFCPKHCDRTGTTAHLTGSYHANLSGGDESKVDQRV